MADRHAELPLGSPPEPTHPLLAVYAQLQRTDTQCALLPPLAHEPDPAHPVRRIALDAPALWVATRPASLMIDRWADADGYELVLLDPGEARSDPARCANRIAALALDRGSV
ncbi:MAG: hypothetical protein RQ752_10330, partial [Thermohalobaculum sp.]|nr:hypothetical protein [Thermohalobaculum sp.]